MRQAWYARAWVLLLITLVSVIGLGFVTPLFDVDEGAFAEATREMLASGNWVSTYLNGEPRHDKPILIYWLQALSVTLLGQHEAAYRLPSMLASLAWVGLLWRFTRQRFGRDTAVMAVWLLVTCWQTTILFKAAIADALLNLLLAATLFAMVAYLEAPSTRRLLPVGIAMGLAFLTKGPVALALPLGSVFIALALTGRLRLFWPAVLSPAAWGPVLVIALPWHVASYLDQGTAFFEGFYLGHNLGRFSDTMESHGGTPLYYVGVLPLLLLPVVAWLPGLLASGIAVLRQREDLVRVLCWCWFLLTFMLFSFSQTQLPHYLVYGMTPLFLLLAERLQSDRAPARWRALPGVLGVVALLGFPLLLHWAPAPDAWVAATVALGRAVYLAHWPWVLALAIALLLLQLWAFRAGGREAVLTSALGFMLAANFVALPVVAAAQQGPVKRAGLIARELPDKPRLTAWRIRMPSFSVYAQAIVPEREPAADDVIFTRIHKIEALRAHTPGVAWSEVYREGGVALLRAESARETEQ